MKEPIQVDTMCSSIDILPTISNLLGIEYDSRLLMGVDVFSDTEPIVALADYSFMTKDLKYVASKDEVYFNGSRLSETTVKNMYNNVKKKFEMSAKILETDYYRIIFGK
jgi:phosphoglycerol transferase MdoB-like AlkP superfamily enzyme